VEDYLIRVIAKEAGVRALACVTTELARETARRHETKPTTSVVLARAMTGGALMGALLKVGHRLAMKLEGSGPLDKVIVESDAYGRLRGYAAPADIDLPQVQGKFNIVGALGRAGLLTVVRDLGLKELVDSVVPLQTSTVDGDLSYYLNQSEQVPSAIEIGVLADETGYVTVAGGFLLQALPPYREGVIQQMADRVQELPPIEDLLNEGKTPEDVLALLFTGMAYKFLEKRPLSFRCTCSWERSEKALMSLGRAEIEHLRDHEGEAVVDCHFCHERYTFDAAALDLILIGME
jgi:molecular chaperone Hsp33